MNNECIDLDLKAIRRLYNRGYITDGLQSHIMRLVNKRIKGCNRVSTPLPVDLSDRYFEFLEKIK